MFLDRGAEALRQCESSLRGIVAEAAGAGQYEVVQHLATWARIVAGLIPDSSPRGAGATIEPDAVASSRPPKAAGRQSQKSSYPKFYRRQDDLVKVGWSKRERKEYQHKAPHAALSALAAAIGKVGGGGKVFPAERCLPLTNPGTNEAIPEYQVYVCLALLKRMDLVDQHGRRGYSLRPTRDFVEAVEATWRQLPES